MTIENDGEPPCGRYTILTEEELEFFINSTFNDDNDISSERQISLFPIENSADEKTDTSLSELFHDKSKTKTLFQKYTAIKQIALTKEIPSSMNIKLNGDFFPSDIAPIIVSSKSGLSGIDVYPMRWGYPASWDKPGRIVINAKSETVTASKLFQDSVLYRRCLIPTMGYYEWKEMPTQANKQKKQKYYIISEDVQIMYLAGIFQQFRDVKTDLIFPHFCIITQSPSDEIMHIHSRMPMVIPHTKLYEWLNCGETTAEVSEFMLSIKTATPKMAGVAVQ